MFSQTTEYALRTVAWLAMHRGKAHTTGEIAAGTQVGASYLSKVLQTLAKAGLVRSQRGLGGGISLAVSPAELTLLDVINAVDSIQRIESCPLNLPANFCCIRARMAVRGSRFGCMARRSG